MAKAAKAIALLERQDCVLSVQVLQEFYVQTMRASRPTPLPHTIAAELIRTWLRFQVREINGAILHSALEIKAIHGFSYWDSAILAAASATGCNELYTEDLAHGRLVEGVKIINPFR